MTETGGSRGGPRGTKTVRSGREIIHIQVGKSGCAVGHEFWRDLCQEHRLDLTNQSMLGTYTGDNDIYEDHLDVFFNEGGSRASKSRWVPRCILVDLNMHDLAFLTQDSLGDLYRPENVVGSDEGSGNCYAKAFHTEGPDLADRCLELVRKEVERCNCLQGVQFTHSVCGGTGSGLTGLLLSTLHDYLDKDSKCIMQTFTLVPSPRFSDILVEPYNAALGLQDLLDHCQQAFLFDNQALGDLVHRAIDLETPKMSVLNNVVALCMSGITSALRFTGPLNCDLGKMQTNLVPFKNAHFLITGFAPLTNEHKKQYRGLDVTDLAQHMICKENVTISCDPLNPGDIHQDPPILPSRFLAAWSSWRGNFQTYEVDQVIRFLQKPNSRFEKFFPDWIPNAIASNICSVPHKEVGESVCFTSNNTAVSKVFERLLRNWDKMFHHKSHVHVYEMEGISRELMMESRNVIQYIMDQYLEFARWDDKLFEDNPGVGGRPMIKESAIENDEQQKIATQLQELRDGDMYISGVDIRGGRG